MVQIQSIAPALKASTASGVVAHVAHLDVLEVDFVLLQPVVGHHFERIELERAERLALQLLGRVEAGPRNDDAALDAAARDDLHRAPASNSAMKLV